MERVMGFGANSKVQILVLVQLLVYSLTWDKVFKFFKSQFFYFNRNNNKSLAGLLYLYYTEISILAYVTAQ